MKELSSSIDLQRVHHGADGIVTAHCGVFVINLADADLHSQNILDLTVIIRNGSDEKAVAGSVLILDRVHEHVLVAVPVALGDFNVGKRGELVLCRELLAIVEVAQMDANEGIIMAPGNRTRGDKGMVNMV